MLDRTKLILQIKQYSDDVFFDYSHEHKIAQDVWEKICDDQDFEKKIKDADLPWPVPDWCGNLADTFEINKIQNYNILSTDGSQIYPDRHEGTSCYLINIGSIVLQYGQSSSAKISTVPFLYPLRGEEGVEVVDCQRQDWEFKIGLEHALTDPQNIDLFLFDGSLIFWHLDSKSKNLGQEFLGKYLGHLHIFFKENILIAGYISLPKSKEILNLIRGYLMLNNKNINLVEHIVDTDVASFYLAPLRRTQLFKNNSKISAQYPTHLQPYFFYMNVGSEIVRIEIPSWIAHDPIKVELISSVILDQCLKGNGYPVSLAEAHQQAVIKNYDREFFYSLLRKMSVQAKHKILYSQKIHKKKYMPI